MALTSRAALGQCGTSSSTWSRSTISSCLMCAQPQEWRAGHIAEALCITGAEFPARSEEVPRDQPVSVCCWRSVSLLGHGELAPAPWSPAGRQYCGRHGGLAGCRAEDEGVSHVLIRVGPALPETAQWRKSTLVVSTFYTSYTG